MRSCSATIPHNTFGRHANAILSEEFQAGQESTMRSLGAKHRREEFKTCLLLLLIFNQFVYLSSDPILSCNT
jgi:hypothetical protein